MIDLAHYDVVLVNSSGGKDSQAMLDLIAEQATAQGVLDRVLVVHADLGRVEWTGTRELAQEQAEHYGVRFVVVSRIGVVKTSARGRNYRVGEVFGDLLDYVRRHMKWPDAQNRWCTADFKRAPVRKLMTRIVADLGDLGRKVRILNCQGIRAEESPSRAKRIRKMQAARPDSEAVERDADASNSKRDVDLWYPIADWKLRRVWARILASGVRHHRAYDLGMPRLSCAFCVFAPEAALMIAGRHNRELLAEYVKAEQEIGHTFRKSLPIARIQERLDAGEEPRAEGMEGWCM